MAGIPGFVPSNITLSPFAQSYVDNANVQIAPWIMGTFADLFLQGPSSSVNGNPVKLIPTGILAAQTANYFSYRDVDGSHRRFTWLIVTLTILCLLKSAQNITIVWDTVIANFANPDVSMMLVAFNWWHYTESLSVSSFIERDERVCSLGLDGTYRHFCPVFLRLPLLDAHQAVVRLRGHAPWHGHLPRWCNPRRTSPA